MFFFYKSRQLRNQKMLFNKCNPTIPSVVLPRPAWQEKAHCVAAGSFCIFIICDLFYFLSVRFWSRYYLFENHGFLSICWSFQVCQVLFNFVFRDTCFLQRSRPVSKSRQECRSRLRLDKSPPQLGLSHTEVGQSYRMKTFFKSMLKQADLRPSLQQV